MKESTKGMLLSGLVYPGLGQLILGRVLWGIVFVFFATAGFIVLIYRIIQRSARVADQILPLLADDNIDLNSLKDLLGRNFTGGWGLENACLAVIVGCWLVAIVHAYYVGKKIDRQSR